MKLAIDLDGVIIDLVGALLPRLSEHVGSALTHSDITSYSIAKSVGKDPTWEEQFWEEVYRDGLHRVASPIPGAIEGIAALAEEEITLVTSRPTVIQADTQDWLKHHGLGRFEVVHQDLAAQNPIALAYHLVIDDNPTVVKKIVRCGLRVCLFDQPWNQEVVEGGSLYRAKGWPDVIDIVSKLKAK